MPTVFPPRSATRCLSSLSLFVACAVVLLAAAAQAGETTDLKASFEMQGKVPDMQQSTNASGQSFRVNFRGISYRAQIERTLVENAADQKHTIWVSLEKVVLTIRSTDVSGGRRSARCGPLHVTLGGTRPMWIGFDVQRSGEDSNSLKLVNTRFRLARENLSVGSPEWVRTTGLGMTEGRVVSGIRNGVTNNCKLIEEQLLDIADDLFAQVREQVEPMLNVQHVAAN